jgi:endonuclease G
MFLKKFDLVKCALNKTLCYKFFKIFLIISLLSIELSCTSRSAKSQLNRNKESTIQDKVIRQPTVINDSLEIVKDKSTGFRENKFLYPTSTTGQIIHHKYYSLSYSEEDEQAEWVAYKIVSNKLQNIDRTNDFREDPNIRTGSAEIYDYQGSGYDRGHLAPAKTMSLNETSMSESFYMSNMSPQIPGFNRGIWKRLEEKIRYWAEANDSLYVVTGPILDRPIDLIGDNDVTVPRAFYKTIVGFTNENIKGIAFVIPNQESDKSLYSYVVSIDEVEGITGIDFYYNLDSQIQNEVEANTNVKLWFLRK